MKKKYIIKKARKLLVEQINSHQTIVRNDIQLLGGLGILNSNPEIEMMVSKMKK